MEREMAETLALRALSWLLGNEELLPVFLGSTGASAEDLKTRAGEPEFLASVMDFILMDDAWVVAFCEAEALSYDAPVRARQALPGGGQVHWT